MFDDSEQNPGPGAGRQADCGAGRSPPLNADPRIFARHIDVYADNGVVHLGGYVWDQRDFMKLNASLRQPQA